MSKSKHIISHDRYFHKHDAEGEELDRASFQSGSSHRTARLRTKKSIKGGFFVLLSGVEWKSTKKKGGNRAGIQSGIE